MLTTIYCPRIFLLPLLLLLVCQAAAATSDRNLDTLPTSVQYLRYSAEASLIAGESVINNHPTIQPSNHPTANNISSEDSTLLSVCLWTGARPMKEVLVQLSSQASNQFALPAGNCAVFRQGQLPPGSYTVTPLKDDNDLQGVSTFDLVRIARHLQNIEPFQQPWQWVAADANRSNTVTMFDLWQLRQLILGVLPELPDNQSWRFYEAGYVFPFLNPLEEPLPESVDIRIGSLPEKLAFQAVKVGDVDGNARANQDQEMLIPVLALPAVVLSAGETIDLLLSLDRPDEYLGLQCALSVDPAALEIEQIQPGQLPDLAIGRPGPGMITMNWFDVFPRTITSNMPLLQVRLKARKTVSLQEAVRIDTDQLHPETYDARERIQSLSLRFLINPQMDVFNDQEIPLILDAIPALPGVVTPTQVAEEG